MDMNDLLAPELAAQQLLALFRNQAAGVAVGIDYTSIRQNYIAAHGKPKEFIAALKHCIDNGWLKFDHGGFTLALTEQGLSASRA